MSIYIFIKIIQNLQFCHLKVHTINIDICIYINIWEGRFEHSVSFLSAHSCIKYCKKKREQYSLRSNFLFFDKTEFDEVQKTCLVILLTVYLASVLYFDTESDFFFSFMWKRKITLYWNLRTSGFHLFFLFYFNLLLCWPATNFWGVLRGKFQSINVNHCIRLLLF